MSFHPKFDLTGITSAAASSSEDRQARKQRFINKSDDTSSKKARRAVSMLHAIDEVIPYECTSINQSNPARVEALNRAGERICDGFLKTHPDVNPTFSDNISSLCIEFELLSAASQEVLASSDCAFRLTFDALSGEILFQMSAPGKSIELIRSRLLGIFKSPHWKHAFSLEVDKNSKTIKLVLQKCLRGLQSLVHDDSGRSIYVPQLMDAGRPHVLLINISEAVEDQLTINMFVTAQRAILARRNVPSSFIHVMHTSVSKVQENIQLLIRQWKDDASELTYAPPVVMIFGHGEPNTSTHSNNPALFSSREPSASSLTVEDLFSACREFCAVDNPTELFLLCSCFGAGDGCGLASRSLAGALAARLRPFPVVAYTGNVKFIDFLFGHPSIFMTYIGMFYSGDPQDNELDTYRAIIYNQPSLIEGAFRVAMMSSPSAGDQATLFNAGDPYSKIDRQKLMEFLAPFHSQRDASDDEASSLQSQCRSNYCASLSFSDILEHGKVDCILPTVDEEQLSPDSTRTYVPNVAVKQIISTTKAEMHLLIAKAKLKEGAAQLKKGENFNAIATFHRALDFTRIEAETQNNEALWAQIAVVAIKSYYNIALACERKEEAIKSGKEEAIKSLQLGVDFTLGFEFPVSTYDELCEVVEKLHRRLLTTLMQLHESVRRVQHAWRDMEEFLVSAHYDPASYSDFEAKIKAYSPTAASKLSESVHFDTFGRLDASARAATARLRVISQSCRTLPAAQARPPSVVATQAVNISVKRSLPVAHLEREGVRAAQMKANGIVAEIAPTQAQDQSKAAHIQGGYELAAAVVLSAATVAAAYIQGEYGVTAGVMAGAAREPLSHSSEVLHPNVKRADE